MQVMKTKSEPKILFVDIDFTLLTAERELTEENDTAIREALAAGHRVVICSGRPLGGILPLAKKLNLTGEGCYLISYNGALIYDCGADRVIFKETLPLEDVRVLFDKADEHGLYIHTYFRDKVLLRKLSEESDYYVDRIGIQYVVEPNLPEAIVEEPVKVILIELHDKSRLEAYRKEVAPLLAGRVSLFYSSEVLLECVKEGISKGDAVRRLCRHLNLPVTSSIAAGDSENDISMLKAAHIGCAVANATDECKAAADYVTERDCDHSGVAEIIRKFMLCDDRSSLTASSRSPAGSAPGGRGSPPSRS